MTDARAEAMAQVRAVYEDGEAEINGRSYKFHKMMHTERRKVFAFYTSVQAQMQNQSFAFLDTPAYEAVEKVMFGAISYDGNLVKKLADHWDECPEDYLQLVSVAMGVISYPFLRGVVTSSPSPVAVPSRTTSKKPM